jgi:hypothetical protein
VTRLLALYPRAWRERYGTEFVALLDELEPTPALIADIAVGAIGAHFDELVERPAGRGLTGWTLTKRGDSMVRALLALLTVGTTAVAAFATFHALWLDTDASPFRALAALSFAVPAVIGVFTLIALVRVPPGSRHQVARTATAIGVLLIVIGIVGGLNVLVIGMRTGDYEGWVATVDAALVVQGALTALYFSGRLDGSELTTS